MTRGRSPEVDDGKGTYRQHEGALSRTACSCGGTALSAPPRRPGRGRPEQTVREDAVYRYLPTFLFEKQYAPAEAIARLYDEGLRDSLILGVFSGERFCGLAEIYGYRAPIRKASVGYRLLREEWGKGIATEALGLLIRELLENRGIEIITASTMVENRASARVLEKNGFTLVARAVDEDWGYPAPTPADKWIR